MSALAASVLTACAVSVPGGIIGGILSLVLLLAVFLGTATTTTGCDPQQKDPKGPEMDGGADVPIGPCLSDVSVGSCLSRIQPDMEVDVGPCLQPPPPEMDAEIGPCLTADASIGPCLGAPLPDAGPDAAPDAAADAADADPDAEFVEDPPVGPCLSPPAPGRQSEPHGLQYHEAPPGAPGEADRKAVLARVLERGGLPADVGGRIEEPIVARHIIEDMDSLPFYRSDLLERYWPRAHDIGRKLQVYLLRGGPYRHGTPTPAAPARANIDCSKRAPSPSANVSSTTPSRPSAPPTPAGSPACGGPSEQRLSPRSHKGKTNYF